jgi:hypothetical protein
MIAAVMVMVMVAISYASTILDSRLAENEFASCKQFMLATGLQIDNVAWTIGRTQTISYSSRYGSVKFLAFALNYSVQVHSASGWETVLSNTTTGVVMFNMPISSYNLGNNYYERILPSQNSAFLQEGPSASVSQVFVYEIIPLNNENYLRIVAAPSVRVFNSSITGPASGTQTLYSKFFLPCLLGSPTNPNLSQSVTMVGGEVTKVVRSGIDRVNVTVSFPSASLGFNSTFFNFDRLVESKSLPAGSVVEFYIGKVTVALGIV